MGYRDLFAVREHRELIEGRQKLFLLQILSSILVVMSALVVWFINVRWVDFFPYTYFSWEFAFSDVTYFWPLFLWGLALSAVTAVGARSSPYDETLLGWSLVTGWFAAIWEEFAYRWFYICFGMIGIIFMNWLFGSMFGWVLAAGFLLLAIKLFLDDEALIGLLLLVPAFACALFARHADPLFWLYETVFMPILNFASFGAYTDIIDPTQYDPVFIMGAIAANAWFRDGHKYQGLFGVMNSWLAGFVLLYATLNYGLLTAVVIHGLWNSQIAIVRYLARKISWVENNQFS